MIASHHYSNEFTDQQNQFGKPKSVWLYFGGFIIFSWFLLFINDYLLIDDYLLYDFYGAQLSYERVQSIVESYIKWHWLAYPALIIYYFLKLISISSCLYVGVLLIGWPVSFQKIFKISIIAETLFFLIPIIKIIWFLSLNRNFTLYELYNFHPLSLQSLLGTLNIPSWFDYPFKLLNIFELAYWFVLAYLLRKVSNESLKKTFALVASSYGIALVLFATFVVFLSVTHTT